MWSTTSHFSAPRPAKRQKKVSTKKDVVAKQRQKQVRGRRGALTKLTELALELVTEVSGLSILSYAPLINNTSDSLLRRADGLAQYFLDVEGPSPHCDVEVERLHMGVGQELDH